MFVNNHTVSLTMDIRLQVANFEETNRSHAEPRFYSRSRFALTVHTKITLSALNGRNLPFVSETTNEAIGGAEPIRCDHAFGRATISGGLSLRNFGIFRFGIKS